jgi:hypothetical protein
MDFFKLAASCDREGVASAVSASGTASAMAKRGVLGIAGLSDA